MYFSNDVNTFKLDFEQIITFHSYICLEKVLEFKTQATPTSTVFWLKFYLQSQVEFFYEFNWLRFWVMSQAETIITTMFILTKLRAFLELGVSTLKINFWWLWIISTKNMVIFQKFQKFQKFQNHSKNCQIMVVFQKFEGKTTTLKNWIQKFEGKTSTLNFWNRKFE